MDQDHGQAGAEGPQTTPERLGRRPELYARFDHPEGTQDIQEDVTAFHEKHGFAIGGSTEPWDEEGGVLLQEFADAMRLWVKRLREGGDHGFDGTDDLSFEHDLARQRVSLIAEELGELAEAVAAGLPIPVFDALCDLNYVVTGSAVAWGMPLTRGTKEVHRSNMTKDVGLFKPMKGPAYSEPDLKPILGYRPETDGAPPFESGTKTGRISCAEPNISNRGD